jgi:hypothetical protein
VIVPEDGIGAKVLPGTAAGVRAGALGRHELVPGMVGRGCWTWTVKVPKPPPGGVGCFLRPLDD